MGRCLWEERGTGTHVHGEPARQIPTPALPSVPTEVNKIRARCALVQRPAVLQKGTGSVDPPFWDVKSGRDKQGVAQPPATRLPGPPRGAGVTAAPSTLHWPKPWGDELRALQQIGKDHGSGRAPLRVEGRRRGR